MLFFCVGYTLLIRGAAMLMPGKGDGLVEHANGKEYHVLVGQAFSGDQYFWSRPSAVEYNAAGSGGSNKGPTNPDYLAQVQARIDTFLAHNPGIQAEDIPSDLVTASGSGLDPHISVEGARIQAKRIAAIRQLDENTIFELIDHYTEQPLLGLFGPACVRVVQLNIALDNL